MIQRGVLRLRRIWRVGTLLILAVGACPQAARAQAPEAYEALDSLLSVRIHAAARHAQLQADAPAAVSVITAEEIAALGARTLAEVLDFLPGFHTSYDHNYTYIGVRGFGRPTDYNNRTLVLLDGAPINEGVYGGVAGGTDLGIDVAALQRIEVVRGPVSALYGGNAMLAVVNLVTRSPTESRSMVAVEGGDRGVGRASAQAAFTRLPGGAALFAAAFAGTDAGIDLPAPSGDGMIRGRNTDRYAGGLASLKVGGVTVRTRLSTRTKQVPTGSWHTVAEDPRNETTDSWVAASVEYDRWLGARTALLLGSGFDIYRYAGTYVWSDDVLHDATDAHRGFVHGLLTFDPSPAWRLMTGASFTDHPRADYRTAYEAAEDEFIDKPFRAASLFTQAEFNASRLLTITFGGRADAEEGRPTHVTPRLAFVLRPMSKTTLKLLYGDAFREPNVYEREYASPQARLGGGLERERLRTGEIALDRQVGAGSVRLSAFTWHFDDLIEAGYDADADLSIYDNSGSARTEGLEAELTAPFGRWLVRAGALVLRTRDGHREPLTNAPTRSAAISVSGPLTARLSAAAQLRGESSRLTLDGERTAAHGLLDANLTARLTSTVRLGVRAANLLDTQYAHPAGAEHVQSALPQPGRSLTLRLEYVR